MNALRPLLLILSLVVAAAVRAEVSILPAHDLAADGRDARERGVAILLVFSADHCPYCERLEENIIRPLLISGDYDNKVVVRKVDLGRGAELRDFDGDRRSPRDLAARYRATLTPTVLLVDAEGKPLVPRIRGINTIDYYWETLDGSIDQALAKLRAARAIARRP